MIIIPDGTLHLLNFDQLLTSLPDESERLRQYPYVIRNHCINYAHSLRTWQEMGSHSSDYTDAIAIAPDFKGSNYSELMNVKNELKALRKNYKTRLFDGAKANRNSLSKTRAGIFHFATHGVLNSKFNNYSYILLQSEAGLDTLYLSELYQMEFKNAMVVLTACETHTGDEAKGEGLISTSRAFAFGGASSIIASQWLTNEEQAGKIMRHFYKNLSQGERRDEALRNAKLAVLANSKDERDAHPYFWSSLVHIGNTDAIPGNKFAFYKLFVGVIGLGLIIYAFSKHYKASPEAA